MSHYVLIGFDGDVISKMREMIDDGCSPSFRDGVRECIEIVDAEARRTEQDQLGDTTPLVLLEGLRRAHTSLMRYYASAATSDGMLLAISTIAAEIHARKAEAARRK